MVLSEGWYSNPSVLTAKSLVNKKGGCVAIKMQQDNSLCLAVNPPPFDKGGKFSARRGIVRFWEGWCGGADELSVTGNFKVSVGTAMKETICF